MGENFERADRLASGDDKTVERTIGYIGLGKMGSNMVRNLAAHNFGVVVYDKNLAVANSLANERIWREYGSITAAKSVSELVKQVPYKRAIWMQVPHTAVDELLNELEPICTPEDIIIDGGNSHYEQSIKRAERLCKKGIYFLDVGTSGGLKGARDGACLTIGGNEQAYDELRDIFAAVAAEHGYVHTGPSGTGHGVKMIHNGIEYGVMQAISEGAAQLNAYLKEMLKNTPYKPHHSSIVRQTLTAWNNGSIIESKLLGYLVAAKGYDIDLERVSEKIGGGETGGWALAEARRLNAPCNTLTIALEARRRSQIERPYEDFDSDKVGTALPEPIAQSLRDAIERRREAEIEQTENVTYMGKCISAMRHEFGGHK